jgi:Spy/CpxP family protein refolding chaperone
MKKIYFAIAMAAMLLFSMGAFARVSQSAQSAQEHSGAGQGQGAGEGRGQGMMTPEAMLDHMTKELNLTDDQQAKLKPIIDEHFKQANEVRQDTSLSREDRHAKMKQLHEDMISQARPILNPDQQKKLDEMVSRHGNSDKDHPNKESGSDSHPQ